MDKQSKIKQNLIDLYKEFDDVSEINAAIDRLFADYRPLLETFKTDYQAALDADVETALEINRIYYDLVEKQTATFEELAKNNATTIKESTLTNEEKIAEINKRDKLIASKSKMIIANAEIDAKREIIEAEEKLASLIENTNKEIETAKAIYLENADKLIKEKRETLNKLADEYQQNIDSLRAKQRKRNQIYEAQVAQVRQIRENYVFQNNELYKKIKDGHTSFSIYHNSHIDEISNWYRDEVKNFNTDYQNLINALSAEVIALEEAILQKDLEIKDKITTYSEELKIPFQELKKKHDEEIRLVLFNQNKKINEIKDAQTSFEREINNQIKVLKTISETGNKSKEARKEYQRQVKPLNLKLKEHKVATQNEIKETKDQNQILFKELNASFILKRQELDLKFVEFEYEILLEKEEFIQEKNKKVALLNLQIESLEEEKNHKIWLLTNSYNKDISHLEGVLALGSRNQELLIQDQVGQNSLLLADNVYHNELVKVAFEIDSEKSNLDIKILKINYQHQVKQTTAKYQLLIQEEMIKRDALVQQYEYEILMEKENLKKTSLEAFFSYDLLKMRTEYEKDYEYNENQRTLEQLEYYLNLKKIKLENLTKKQEASLQLQNAKAKADRNYAMYKISVEKNDRLYLALFEIIFALHERIDIMNEIIHNSYHDPDFSMTSFYHLIDNMVESCSSLKDDLIFIFTNFEDESNDFITKKIEELTGFKYMNKKQELLDNTAKSEDLIKAEIENVYQERSNLESELNQLDQIKHRDGIQISTLYKNIQALKDENINLETSDDLVKLVSELAVLKAQVKINEKTSRQLERQIANKEKQLLPLKKRLADLDRTYNLNKRRLSDQLRKDARIYYRQQANNLKEFNKSKILVNKYIDNLVLNLTTLKTNLTKTVEAINIHQKRFNKLRVNFLEKMHQSFNNFRQINLTIYKSQVNDQKNIVNGLNNSYLTLNRNLNSNYESNFASEKRKHNNRNKSFDLAQSKLHSNFFHKNNQANQAFNARSKAINNTLEEYDFLFTNTFTNRTQMISTIRTNDIELEKDLTNQTNDLIKESKHAFNSFYNRKKSLLRESSLQQSQLYNSTRQRSLQYRETYLSSKEAIEESLVDLEKNHLEQARDKERNYRKYLRRNRQIEFDVKRRNRKSLYRALNTIKQRYQIKLKQIENNTY